MSSPKISPNISKVPIEYSEKDPETLRQRGSGGFLVALRKIVKTRPRGCPQGMRRGQARCKGGLAQGLPFGDPNHMTDKKPPRVGHHGLFTSISLGFFALFALFERFKADNHVQQFRGDVILAHRAYLPGQPLQTVVDRLFRLLHQ